MTVTVVLAIRNKLARFGIENMLRSVDLVSDHESFGDIESAVGTLRRSDGRPGGASVVLVVALSEVDDDVTAELKALAGKGVKILVMVDDVDQALLGRMAEASGSGFVFADELGVPMLERTLHGMQQGEMPMPARLTRLLLSAAVDGNATAAGRTDVRMTPREREVLTLLVEGLSNKQIARRLAISEHGAKRHVANILAKLNCPNRTLAVAKALQEGLCGPGRPVTDAPSAAGAMPSAGPAFSPTASLGQFGESGSKTA